MDRNISLTNGIITLRPYRKEDAGSAYEAVKESIPELSPWLPFAHPDYSVQESRDWISLCFEKWEQGDSYDFTIRDAATDRCLGGCGLSVIHQELNIANLGYWVKTSATKKGTATAATLLLADFGIKELKLNRIEIVIDVDNKASQRVAEKVGATREGIMRNRLTLNGKPSDAVMFSLIPDDLNK